MCLKCLNPVVGKVACVRCGSLCGIEKHHDQDRHLGRRNIHKNPHTIPLCYTCHFLEHSEDGIALFHKGLLKRYNIQMDELLHHFDREARKKGQNI